MNVIDYREMDVDLKVVYKYVYVCVVDHTLHTQICVCRVCLIVNVYLIMCGS